MIVGAGLAGATAARTLREEGFDGRIVRLREAFAHGGAVTVVGAGQIGCEVAATARTLGAEVTLVERDDAPLDAAPA